MLEHQTTLSDTTWKKRLLRVAAVLGVTLALALGMSLSADNGEGSPAVAHGAAPVVLELFTSQGCSSCPPADRLLSRLAESGIGDGQVIPLSFHVDYWNYIGWTDPFSSEEWSRRQSYYAREFRSSRVYTPQLVINGNAECVGSDERVVREEIAKAIQTPAAGHVDFEIVPGDDVSKLALEISARVEHPDNGNHWTVVVAVFENDLVTPVSKGENGGRTLRNSNVVRSLTEAFSVPVASGEKRASRVELALDKTWRRDRLGVAVFLQNVSSGQIHGAATRQLAG